MNPFKETLLIELAPLGHSPEHLAKLIKEPVGAVCEWLETKRREKVARQQAQEKRRKYSAHERAMCKSTRYIPQGERGGRGDETMPLGNRVPSWLAARLRATHSPDNRSLTGRVMGDPLPHQQRWKH